MKHIFLVALTTILSTTLFGQNQIQIDFENDGKMDNANLKKTEEGYFIQYTLSTDGKKHTTKIITMGGQENKLTVKKNVLIINSQFMRGENYFKFRYDKKQKKIILIGYDNNQYGNASNDGSGSSSYNLITGNYEANWYSFDENKNESSIVAYPNPTYDILYMNVKNAKSVIITNVFGNIIYSNLEPQSKISIDISNLPNGVYFIQMENMNAIKFVKQ